MGHGGEDGRCVGGEILIGVVVTNLGSCGRLAYPKLSRRQHLHIFIYVFRRRLLWLCVILGNPVVFSWGLGCIAGFVVVAAGNGSSGRWQVNRAQPPCHSIFMPACRAPRGPSEHETWRRAF